MLPKQLNDLDAASKPVPGQPGPQLLPVGHPLAKRGAAGHQRRGSAGHVLMGQSLFNAT